MFYNSTAIQTLIDRIGWAAAIQPSTIVLSSAAAKSDSGRYFSGFHRMAIVENMKPLMPNKDADNTAFSAWLVDLKREGVMNVLDRVFDNNERAFFLIDRDGNRVDISAKDYSETIITINPRLFDKAIGLQVAYNALEAIAVSTRSNGVQRSTQASYEEIKNEQDGFTDENGKALSAGLKGKLTGSISSIIDILFPKATTGQPRIKNASYKW
jgi:hypothetical protein